MTFIDKHNDLKRGLSNRHIQLIAIGGTIGTSLFLGSSKAISIAGPIIVLNYAIAGALMFLGMRILGEMLLSNTNFITFKDFVNKYFGKFAGFLVGWFYSFFWIVTGMQDAVAVGIYVKSWFPNMPLLLPGVIVIGLIFLLNSITVSVFGELEFWLSIIKVITIIVFILTCLYFLITSKSVNHTMNIGGESVVHSYTSNIANLYNSGGFAPHGITGFLLGFQLSFLAYTGIESIGVTAGEAKDPQKVLPKAINAVPFRIGLFYVGSIFFTLCVIPWDVISGLSGSVYINIFKSVGIAAASVLMTFVLISAALSGANGGLYSTSRMIYSLSRDGEFFKKYGVVSKRKVPQNALNLVTIIILVPVIVAAILVKNPMDAFIIFAAWATGCMICVWIIVLLTYFFFVKKFKNLHIESKYKAIGGRAVAGVVLTAFTLILFGMLADPVNRIGLLLTVIMVFALFLFYRFRIKNTQMSNDNE